MSKHGPITAANMDRDELRRRWSGSESISEISAAMEASPTLLRKVAGEMKLGKRTHVMGRRAEVLQDNPLILKMWNEGKSQRSIAAMVGVSDYAIADLAKRCAYPPRNIAGGAKGGTFWTDEERETVIAMRKRGCTFTEISVVTQRSVSSIGEVVRKAGLSKPRKEVNQFKAKRDETPKPKDLSLGGRLRDTKGSYAMLSDIAAKQGWTQTQVQQRYHRAMSGEAVQ